MTLLSTAKTASPDPVVAYAYPAGVVEPTAKCIGVALFSGQSKS